MNAYVRVDFELQIFPHHGWCGIVSENNDTFFRLNMNNRLIGGVVAWERGADRWEKFPT